MVSLILVFSCIAALFATCHARDLADEGCIKGLSYNYKGNQDHTATGIKCQRWDRREPHVPRHVPQDGGHHNYCRNPDKDVTGTWCYTVDPTIKWGYCHIPKCVDDTIIVWTSYHEHDKESYFSKVNADPEFVSQQHIQKSERETTQKFGYSYDSHYKALETDFRKKRIYFTDIQNDYFGVYDMETDMTEQYLHGMARDIEAISFDAVTGNFYWTDSRMKWVMTADSSFQSYAPVYKANPYTPKALEVHSAKRMLVFSTYIRETSEINDARIITTDLAGKNEKVILKYPNVRNIVSLTIDHAEDRIYWVEYLGYGSKVMSCRMDGSDKTVHYFLDRSDFKDVAVFSDYIYVADAQPRLDFFRRINYQIHVITKRSDQVAAYTVKTLPHGVSVYKENEADQPSHDQDQCTQDCAGICLPRYEAVNECACSLGYQMNVETGECISKISSDNYLLVVDKDQGQVFQMSLETGEDYSIAPISSARRIVSAAADPSTKYVFFSDSETLSLHRGTLGGSLHSTIANAYAKSIEIDPHTGNVFYVDSYDNSITMSNNDGTVQMAIFISESMSSDIKMLALDTKYKYVYWTDTYSKEGEGKVLRSRFDGSKFEVVLDNLDSPHGITVDHQSNKLYVVESSRGKIYELPLLRLKKIDSTSVNQTHCRTIDLLEVISNRRFHLTEIKVHEGMGYIADDMQRQIQKIDLTLGASSLRPFGPPNFYQSSSLSVYSAVAQKKYLKLQFNPCRRLRCRNLCVASSTKKAQCVEKSQFKKLA